MLRERRATLVDLADRLSETVNGRSSRDKMDDRPVFKNEESVPRKGPSLLAKRLQD